MNDAQKKIGRRMSILLSIVSVLIGAWLVISGNIIGGLFFVLVVPIVLILGYSLYAAKDSRDK